MYIYRGSTESCFRNVCGAAGKSITSAPVAVSEILLAADTGSVHSLSTNGRERPLYLRATMYEAFLGVYTCYRVTERCEAGGSKYKLLLY